MIGLTMNRRRRKRRGQEAGLGGGYGCRARRCATGEAGFFQKMLTRASSEGQCWGAWEHPTSPSGDGRSKSNFQAWSCRREIEIFKWVAGGWYLGPS